MKKIGLIIGYGSIGKQHYSVMKNSNIFNKIYILSRNQSGFNIIKKFKEIKKINPDVVIICSETNKHYIQLKYLEKIFKDKIILIEKPVFDKFKKLKIKNNKVFVGYNLRYHPVILYLKSFLKNKSILTANVTCNSYLPEWRKRDYRKIYSAKRNKGGGVHLDLSHEIDYVNWIFEGFKRKKLFLKKISNLKINSYDYLKLIGSSMFARIIDINLNYFSRKNKRYIEIIMNNKNIHADLLENKIEFFYNNTKKIKKFKKVSSKERINFQLKDIIKTKPKYACTYQQALNILKHLDN